MPVSYNLLPSRQTMPWYSFLPDRLFSPHPRIARIQTSFFFALLLFHYLAGSSLIALYFGYSLSAQKWKSTEKARVPSAHLCIWNIETWFIIRLYYTHLILTTMFCYFKCISRVILFLLFFRSCSASMTTCWKNVVIKFLYFRVNTGTGTTTPWRRSF